MDLAQCAPTGPPGGHSGTPYHAPSVLPVCKHGFSGPACRHDVRDCNDPAHFPDSPRPITVVLRSTCSGNQDQDIVVVKGRTAMIDPWALMNVGCWFLFAVWLMALHLCRDEQADDLN